MESGKWRFEVGAMGSGARIKHIAACPEISPVDCSNEPFPDHWHDQKLILGRLRLGWEVGLGKGFQVAAALPLDIKSQRVEYFDMFGDDYDPPYAGIHHRNEVLAGLGDARIGFRQVRPVGQMGAVSIGIGTTLPLGRTEENPYVLGALSQKHQHFQFGTGSFMPFFDASLLLRKDRYGLQIWVGGQGAVYQNKKSFKPGLSGNWGVAPQMKVHPRVDLLLLVEGVHQAKNTWDGVFAPSSGKHTLRVGLMAGFTLKRGLWLYAQASVPVWQQSLSTNTNDQILEPLLGSVGISWAPDKPLWKKPSN